MYYVHGSKNRMLFSQAKFRMFYVSYDICMNYFCLHIGKYEDRSSMWNLYLFKLGDKSFSRKYTKGSVNISLFVPISLLWDNHFQNRSCSAWAIFCSYLKIGREVSHRVSPLSEETPTLINKILCIEITVL